MSKSPDLRTSKPMSLREALEHCLKIFKSQADRGRYPEELVYDSPYFLGRRGWQFLTDALEHSPDETAAPLQPTHAHQWLPIGDRCGPMVEYECPCGAAMYDPAWPHPSPSKASTPLQAGGECGAPWLHSEGCKCFPQNGGAE